MGNISVSSAFIKSLRQQIVRSRHLVSKLVNAEMLWMYFRIGEVIEKEFEAKQRWAKVMEEISARLQQELPWLRGFSVQNMGKMRTFFNARKSDPSIYSSLTSKLPIEGEHERIKNFLSVSFTHHYEILIKEKDTPARWFYVLQAAQNYRSVRHLKTELKNQSHLNQDFPNNFPQALPADLSNKAIQVFKDQYLLDFINVSEPHEEIDERVLEKGIVQNIKKFLMSLGGDFAFMGNQYRLVVDEQEYFIDLLFYHRGLQSLIAIELKSGKFKPEYGGKMNFYLSALDDLIKQPHENPSIGIILCKEKNNTTVEYSLRNMNNPMGVSEFTTTEKLPEKYREVLPDVDVLKGLIR